MATNTVGIDKEVEVNRKENLREECTVQRGTTI